MFFNLHLGFGCNRGGGCNGDVIVYYFYSMRESAFSRELIIFSFCFALTVLYREKYNDLRIVLAIV